MSNFKHHKKTKRNKTYIDGFVPRNSTNQSDIRSRFQSSYRPEGLVSDFSKKPSSNQFNSRNSSEDLNSFSPIEQQIDMELEEERDNKKRFGFKRKSTDKKAHKSPFKKVMKSFAVLSVALMIGMASLFGYGYLKARNIFQGDGDGAAALNKNVDPSKLNGEGDGRVNILVIGKGGPGETAPDLTDTLLLASVDPIANEAALVSVPRDMYVKDQNGYSTKINAVYSNAKQARLNNSSSDNNDEQAAEDAGLNAIKDTVSDVLGVPVHYYTMIDFKSFENAINTLGGITVDVKEPLYDRTVAWELGGNPLIADAGLQTFDGERALFYARSRKGSARGDFDRTERQREIIVATQQKVLSLGTFANPFKVIELMENFGDGVRTDLNGLDELKRLYEISAEIGQDRIASIGLADPPNILVRTDNIGGQSVVVPTAGLYQYDEIHSYIRNNLRDAFLKSEDARVIILNGTDTAGLASATSTELRSYGYNVVRVDNAPTSDYTSNQLIELNPGEKRYTKSYIERRLGLTATTNTIPGIPTAEEADFVIILGTDEILKTTE